MIDVAGADRFLALSKALKAAGRTELRKDLNKGLRDAAKPLLAKLREAEVADLPHRGGLGAFVAGKSTRVVTRTGAAPGVSVVVAKQDPRLDSEGRLVHPVFNRRRANGSRVLVVQRVQPKVFTGALEASGPAVHDAVLSALDTFVDRLAGELR